MNKKTCNPKLCKAECCGYVPININLFNAKKHLIRKPYTIQHFVSDTVLAVGKHDDACAFLGEDFSCIIYPDRPDVCKKFGEKDQDHPLLQCEYLK